MKAIAVLLASFSALCVYLEHQPQQGLMDYGFSAPAHSLQRPAAILPPHETTPVAVAAVEQQPIAPAVIFRQIKPSLKKPSLNMSLPYRANSAPRKLSTPARLRLNPVNRSKNIRYRAELLFDERDGTGVRGGKVDIQIPLG